MNTTKLVRNIYKYTYGLYECLKINLSSFSDNTPVLVYQMGKVGSSTIEMSLKKSGFKNAVYHIHFLSDEGLKSAYEYYKNMGSGIPVHLQRSICLSNKISKSSSVRWKVVTIIREPVGREVSNVFQNLNDTNPETINKKSSYDVDRISRIVNGVLEGFNEDTNFTCKWIDNEINKTLNIDLFDREFDVDKGYSIINENNISLLVLRLEDMSDNFSEAMTKFFGDSEKIEMHNTNIGDSKNYSEAYSEIRKDIKLPSALCKKIYGSKYVKKFYNDKQIAEFITKWSE